MIKEIKNSSMVKSNQKIYNNEPIISIITVVKNDEKNLDKTIQSVVNQKYKNIDYIIIDGKSDDNTVEIIRKYQNKLSFWKSENDDGIYDAFNKGLDHARGDFIGFVNSGDILMPDALNILNLYIKKNPDIDFIFGSVKKHWGILHGYKPWKIYYTWNFYSSHSTGFFIKNKAAKILGKYNTKYKYSADYDYFYRMIVKHKFKGLGTKKNELFGIFQRGGYSSQVNFFNHLIECTKIRLDNNQNKIMVLFTFIIKYIFNYKRI